ncbi:hypothetical protein BpHYR1_016894 [Brachionus plicatilis]|uniref:Uncharacterized protein n=1 Tax=Brachionus plicatilis TaxID=10195 RepID=A0A3M7RGX1_BRAPC|nr:hypothetical protein BpHYR1_016894 [Brachionus plicatilis]
MFNLSWKVVDLQTEWKKLKDFKPEILIADEPRLLQLATARLACGGDLLGGLLTRPECIVSVLELVDGVGICHCNWQGE